jgi:hypothetical protein
MQPGQLPIGAQVTQFKAAQLRNRSLTTVLPWPATAGQPGTSAAAG